MIRKGRLNGLAGFEAAAAANGLVIGRTTLQVACLAEARAFAERLCLPLSWLALMARSLKVSGFLTTLFLAGVSAIGCYSRVPN